MISKLKDQMYIKMRFSKKPREEKKEEGSHRRCILNKSPLFGVILADERKMRSMSSIIFF